MNTSITPELFLILFPYVASWLNENNRDGFMNVYSVVRGQYMKKSLESLRDYVRASSGSKRSTASPSVLRKVTSPIVASEGTPTTSQKKYVKSISKKVSSVTSKLESASGISRRTHGMFLKFRAQSFTSLMANRLQEINKSFFI